MCTQVRKPLPTGGAKDNSSVSALPQDELIRALNRENRALASRIQELLTHIEVREEETKKEEAQLNEHISELQAARERLVQESEEQSWLITELTKKTEDDLNTIMELQQEVAEVRQQWDESREQRASEAQGGTPAPAPVGSRGRRQPDEAASSEKEVQKEEDTHLIAGKQLNGPTADNPRDPSPRGLQNAPQLSSPTDQLDLLTRSIQSLRSERDELSGAVASLREQQQDASLSVRTQTEVKQQLTRAVWALKVEKDDVSRHLEGLRRQQEQLAKEVRQLRDEREQSTGRTCGLAEEQEELAKDLISLKTEKEELLDSIASLKDERDQMMRLGQSLQAEGDQLNHQVLSLKQEEEKHADSLKCLEKADGKQTSRTLQCDLDELMKLISTLREDKERLEVAVGRLKQERRLIGLRQDQRRGGSSGGRPNSSDTTEEESRTEGGATPSGQTISVQVLGNTH